MSDCRGLRAFCIGWLLAISVAAAQQSEVPQHDRLLVHVPGVGGYLPVDTTMLTGLRDGGFDGRIVVFDWTNNAPGMTALHDDRNKERQSLDLAGWLTAELSKTPRPSLVITAHSGGCAIAVWALERLGEQSSIDQLILIAPALSPRYDLSAALKHVRGRVYVLSSEADEVVGLGTKLFGTMDNINTESAGKIGFVRPDRADDAAYEKLVALPYRDEWVELDNPGDHIGPMSRRFASVILGPLVNGAKITPIENVPNGSD